MGQLAGASSVLLRKPTTDVTVRTATPNAIDTLTNLGTGTVSGGDEILLSLSMYGANTSTLGSNSGFEARIFIGGVYSAGIYGHITRVTSVGYFSLAWNVELTVPVYVASGSTIQASLTSGGGVVGSITIATRSCLVTALKTSL